MIDGHGALPVSLSARLVLETRPRGTQQLRNVEVDQAPTSSWTHLVWDELLQRTSVKADVSDADFLQERKERLPVISGSTVVWRGSARRTRLPWISRCFCSSLNQPLLSDLALSLPANAGREFVDAAHSS